MSSIFSYICSILNYYLKTKKQNILISFDLIAVKCPFHSPNFVDDA
jgi:hypothetical protein